MIFVFHVNFWGSRYSCGAHVNMSFYTMNDLCRLYMFALDLSQWWGEKGPALLVQKGVTKITESKGKKTCNIILKTTSPIEFVSNRVTSDSNKKHHFPIRETSKVSLPVATRLSSGRRLTPTRQARWHEGLDPSGWKWIHGPPRGRFDREWLPGMSGTYIYILFDIQYMYLHIYIFIFEWVAIQPIYPNLFVCMYIHSIYIYMHVILYIAYHFYLG